MANRFYSVSVGEQMAHQVTEGASTSGEPIELRVDTTVSKLDLMIALETLEHYIATKETNPIA